MKTGQTDPHQRKVLQLYAAYGAALVLSVVPFVLAAFLSMVLFVGVLIAAYILRTGTEEGSLIENHMTFVIRTLWIGSFLAMLTLVAASLYLFYGVDNTPLDPCIQHFLSIGPGTRVLELQAMTDIFRACYGAYMDANLRIFITSGAMAAGPVLIYFVIRYARGISRAMNGYRIAKPQSWF